MDPDECIDFNFAVSTGLELAVSAEDYLDYALEQPETRVIAVEFADLVKEVDINPIKVLERGCVGLDALIIHKTERVNKDKMAV